MQILTGCLVLVVLLLNSADDTDSKQSDHSFDRPNICTRIESFRKTFEVPKTKRVKTYYKTWCFAIPPVCTQYKWKTVTTIKNVTVNQTRIAYSCCEGYVKQGESCVPVCHLACGHGECIEPDVCLCEEGWRDPDCLSQCEPNRYGRGCVNNCSCLNGGICDRKDGSCSCIAGFTGPYCEFPCPDDKYGKDCRKTCQCQNGAMCDIKDGSCDCEPGYYGEYCENVCELGSHGKDCMFDCICIPETTSTCDPVNGQCLCRPGYRGDYCENECANFTYGRNCEYKCDCVNSEFCEPVEGVCICMHGWTGKRCSEKCPPGSFGEDCMFMCTPCINDTATCNHVTGHCDCPPGSFGDFCETRCQEGYWGSNCSMECDCLGNELCNPVTGECTCPPGWILPNCSDPCSSGWYGYNCSFECNCTDGNSCNATSGNCPGASSEAYEEGTGYSRSIAAFIPLICVGILGTGVAMFLFSPQISRAARSLVGLFTKRVTRDNKISTSTDNIIAEHFSNPLYACFNGIPGADATTVENSVVNNSPPPTSGLQSVNLQIDNPTNTDEKSSNICSEDGQKANRESASSEVSDSSIGSFVRKFKENIRHSGKKSDSNESPVDTEDGFVPEVLGEFKIPEDDTYENVVAACRKTEDAFEEASSQ